MHSRESKRMALISLAVAVLSALATSGCALKGRCVPDDNNEYRDATLIPATGPIKDEINAECDRVDWRYIQNFADASATMTVRVGDPFGGHEMTGFLALYDQDAQILQQAEIRPNENRFEFKLPVVARQRYYLKVEATKGGAPYTVEVNYERIDPCTLCPEGTRCIDNQCVKLPCGGLCPVELCDPATDRCRPADPCGGRCNEDEECDEDSGRCRATRGCRRNADCDSGQQCNRRTGRCYTPRARPPTPTTPTPTQREPECTANADCGSGKQCTAGKCIDAPETPELGPRIVKGAITTVLDSPQGVVLRIAVKPNHGVKAKDRGTAGSHSFEVTKVGSTRLEALIPRLKRAEFGKIRGVSIRASGRD